MPREEKHRENNWERELLKRRSAACRKHVFCSDISSLAESFITENLP